jgi:hypothetical protein
VTGAVRRLAVLLLSSLLVIVAVGCGGDDDGGDASGQPLRVEKMADAVKAVEAELGGEQRYFEVNATPDKVNLFVASPDGTQAIAYVFDAVADTLGPADPPQPATGMTFTWSQADFEPAKVLTEALAQLPTSLPRTFAVTAASDTAVQYLVTLESSQGGLLDVLVDGTGKVLGASARD